MYDYESPIAINVMDKMFNDLQVKIAEENDKRIVQAVCNLGISVNKEQLTKALQFDRQQYDKGYNDAKAEYEKALDRACGILAVYNGYPSKEDEAILYSNCILANGKQKWKEALLKGIEDE